MSTASVSDVVRRYFAAYEAKDRNAIEGLLGADFRFTSPYDDGLGRDGYFERCWPDSARVRAIRVESLVAQDGQAFARYTLETTAGTAYRNAAWFLCAGASIRAIEIYAGALPEISHRAADDGAAPTASSNPTLAPRAADAAHYLCLVYQDDDRLDAMTQRELNAIVADCLAWLRGLEASGRHVFSAGLQSVRTATTLRHRNGKLSVTDGPFAETKEHLGGFTLLTARDLNEAITLASDLAAASTGTIEVRPLMTLDAQLAEPMDRKLATALRSHEQR